MNIATISNSLRSLPVIESRAWLAVALTAVLCANGIWWGGPEIWNADQMAFKDFFREGHLPFSPEKFDKPPLLSYINFFFSMVPREAVVVGLELITGKEYGDSLNFLSVWLAKLLQLLFACGSVYLMWRIAASFATRGAAMISALLLATSAGFIVQSHLITTDLPLVFFMLLAFRGAQRIVTRGDMRVYVLAGVLAGLTGAMKYNGLIVGIAIPVFHAFRAYEGKLLPVIFNRRLIAGVAAVPAGFLLGNPFALIEYRRFATDLGYLFKTSE
ncbi:MAG: ArnT family glycosyltransferase, partial [Woeseiaceae bacterium]